MIRKAFLALGLTLISGSAAWAIPQTLNFQGLLKESGSPVTGTRNITFKIYDVPTGGTSLFTEVHSGGNTVTVSTGIFNAIIGALTSGGIPLSIFSGDDRYVGVTVGAGSELLPRQQVTSVGNAFFAATAANLIPTATIQIYSISASSAIFTATGSAQYSLKTSSGVLVSGGGVTAPFFSGTFVGDGAGLTGLAGTDSTKVAKTGDSMTGQLTLSGSTLTVTGSAFSVGGATLAVAGGKIGVGTVSPATKLHLSSGTLTIDGSAAGISVVGPSTATYFYGDGSGLTGLTGTDSTKVAKAGDAMTGQLTLSGSTLTVTGNAFSVGGSTLVATGGKVGVGTASPATKLHMSSGTFTIDGSGAAMSIAGPSSATYFYGDGSGLTGVSGTDSAKVAKTGDAMSGQLTLSGSTLTITGSAFSVGATTLAVTGGKIGMGTANPSTKLHMSSGTLTIDGSGAGISVAGPSSATYYYGNGSGLTGIISEGGGANVSSYTCVNLTGVTGAGGDRLNQGIANATVSLTGSTFTVHWEANICNTNGCTTSAIMGISFLVDGAFEPPMTSSIACRTGVVVGSHLGGVSSMSCRRTITRAVGSHTFAPTWENTSRSNADRPMCDPVATCLFCVTRDG